MLGTKFVSFVVVVIGPGRDEVGTTVETAQHWEADEARKPDFIADAIVTFSNKHGTTIDHVIVREISS